MLLVGYFTYGRFVEKILSPDDRPTPAQSKRDGVDFLVLPRWKNMLIQLLNIAGIGPVIGVIIGVKFGDIVFWIIPLGNIIAGATHDFISGMMSIRGGGSNLPSIVRANLGSGYAKIFSWFSLLILLLVVAVFVNVPANLIDGEIPQLSVFWYAVAAVFVYYMVATLFPVDKIIGRLYPFFGAVLLLGTLAIFVSIVCALFGNPDLLTPSETFEKAKWTTENSHPVIPLLFVTIACGIISGFHATQSPIVARTIKSERQARGTFYGMMVVEGLIAMVWAAGGMAIYNLFPETFSINPNAVLLKITKHFLGDYVGGLTVLSVVVLAVTSGDTAMRSIRLSFAEMFSIGQTSMKNRILVALPFAAIVALLLYWSNADAASFGMLWNYFAWGNQVLAVSTLFAGSVWLFRQSKNGWVAMLPAMFMCFIVVDYIVWISPEHGGPLGFGVDLHTSYAIAAVATLAVAVVVRVYAKGKTPLK